MDETDVFIIVLSLAFILGILLSIAGFFLIAFNVNL
jgi:hypothetical protein